MNVTQFFSVILVMAAVILPLVLSVYFSESTAPQSEEFEYDYR